jgi:hypothetical protein
MPITSELVIGMVCGDWGCKSATVGAKLRFEIPLRMNVRFLLLELLDRQLRVRAVSMRQRTDCDTSCDVARAPKTFATCRTDQWPQPGDDADHAVGTSIHDPERTSLVHARDNASGFFYELVKYVTRSLQSPFDDPSLAAFSKV